jgi:hypothetical protein
MKYMVTKLVSHKFCRINRPTTLKIKERLPIRDSLLNFVPRKCVYMVQNLDTRTIWEGIPTGLENDVYKGISQSAETSVF